MSVCTQVLSSELRSRVTFTCNGNCIYASESLRFLQLMQVVSRLDDMIRQDEKELLSGKYKWRLLQDCIKFLVWLQCAPTCVLLSPSRNGANWPYMSHSQTWLGERRSVGSHGVSPSISFWVFSPWYAVTWRAIIEDSVGRWSISQQVWIRSLGVFSDDVNGM